MGREKNEMLGGTPPDAVSLTCFLEERNAD
jgi:hypothetical protein